MKRSKSWLFVTISLSFISIGCLIINIGVAKTTSNQDTIAIKILMMFFLGFFTMGFGYMAIYNFFAGNKYFKIHYIPIENFDIKEYDNGFIVIYKNYGWAISKYNRKSIEKDKIKSIQYYNRKKKETGWIIDIPYLRKVA